MKILTVDENVENLSLLEAMLKGAGRSNKVVCAHNGVEALQQLEQQRVHLIVSDILMPQMDGFELCRQVKQRKDLRHIPFIFYTATYTENKDVDFGLRLGASRFITKPVEPEEFLSILRGVIQDSDTGFLVAAPPPNHDDEVLLKAYNGRLVQKLEQKVEQLEQLKQNLQRALEEKEAELAARRKAEEQIRLQAAALGSAANSILITDRDGIIQWVNVAFERFSGYSAAEAIGRTPRLVKSDRQPPGFFEAMWETILTGRVWQGELANKRKDGTLYYEEMTVTPVRDASGEIAHFIAITQDISARKHAEEALRQARDDLARANSELEQKVAQRTAQLVETNASLQAFSHTAAHDLGAPLRAIKSFSTMALEEYGEKLGPDGRSVLQRVVGSVGQMQRLLADLLEYSKMTHAELKLEPVDLRKAVSDALALLDADVRAKNAVVNVTEPLPKVIAHPAMTVLLIHNLASNALKFMPSGVQPQIRIRADSVPSPKSQVRRLEPAEHSGRNPQHNSEPRTSHSASGMVRLWVEDNGIGIAPENRERIFAAFERLHSKHAYPGTGLGLAIVRKGAERMGGRVGVESEQGKGSRFWVELRMAEKQEPGAPLSVSR
jgi:PAS domain S-box-containing protein